MAPLRASRGFWLSLQVPLLSLSLKMYPNEKQDRSFIKGLLHLSHHETIHRVLRSSNTGVAAGSVSAPKLTRLSHSLLPVTPLSISFLKSLAKAPVEPFTTSFFFERGKELRNRLYDLRTSPPHPTW